MHLFVLLKTAADSAESLSEALWQLPGVLGIEELPADGSAFQPDSAHNFLRFDQRQQFDQWLRTESFPVAFLKIYLDLPSDEALPAWLKQLQNCELVTYGTVVPCDYVATIREQFHGHTASKFWIGPPWQAPPAGKLPVIIEPGMAFGLGDHPTTQMCLELLEKVEFAPRHILDIGTGTGILAIAAGKLWPDAELVLTDLDHECRNGVEHNFSLNNLSVPSLQFYGSQSLPDGTFDLVLSNIFLDALCELTPRIAALMPVGGTWVASGLLGEEQATELQRRAGQFQVVCQLQRENWFALALRRSNSED